MSRAVKNTLKQHAFRMSFHVGLWLLNSCFWIFYSLFGKEHRGKRNQVWRGESGKEEDRMEVLFLVNFFEAYGTKAIIFEKNGRLLLSSQQEREKTWIENYGRLRTHEGWREAIAKIFDSNIRNIFNRKCQVLLLRHKISEKKMN